MDINIVEEEEEELWGFRISDTKLSPPKIPKHSLQRLHGNSILLLYYNR